MYSNYIFITQYAMEVQHTGTLQLSNGTSGTSEACAYLDSIVYSAVSRTPLKTWAQPLVDYWYHTVNSH